MKTILLILLLVAPAEARSVKKAILKVAEHVALGAGVEIAVSRVAGGPQKWPAGIVAAGAVAGFKEGTDAHDGKDSWKMAVAHSLTILGGAGLAAAIKH